MKKQENRGIIYMLLYSYGGGIDLKKRLCVLAALSLTVISLVGCSGDDDSYSTTDSSYESSNYEDDNSDSDDSGSSSSSSHNSDSSDSSSSYSDSSSKAIEHYCESDGCYKEGTEAITGFSGETEYYCYDHYQEIQDIISMMEEDVGSGTASKHQCEECSKEGTRELVGFSGETEYYCTEHYNEIIEILNMMYGDE